MSDHMTDRQKAAYAIYQEHRKKYLDADLETQPQAHREFYSWLIAFLGIPMSVINNLRLEIEASTDEHFNDIQLAKWDALDHRIREYGGKIGWWSLSDTVCCAKEMARQYKENHAKVLEGKRG